MTREELFKLEEDTEKATEEIINILYKYNFSIAYSKTLFNQIVDRLLNEPLTSVITQDDP